METLDSSPITSVQIKQWARKDPLLSKVKDLFLIGGQHNRDAAISPYLKYWSKLLVHDGFLLWGNHVVISLEGWTPIMELLHEGHPGNARMKGLAHFFVWWLGIGYDLAKLAKISVYTVLHWGWHPVRAWVSTRNTSLKCGFEAACWPSIQTKSIFTFSDFF